MSLLTCSGFSPTPVQRKWNESIKKRIHVGDPEGAILTYLNMQLLGIVADNYTYPLLLKAAGTCSTSCVGFALHAHTLKTGFAAHAFVQTALMNMYGTFNRVADACKVFDTMPKKDVVAWNSMLDAFASNGMMEEALNLFNSMPLKDFTSFNIMISGYSSKGKIVSARGVFDEMTLRDSVSWNSIITAYARVGVMETAGKFFREMPIKNVITWNAMITGCLQTQLYEEAIDLFGQMIAQGCASDFVTVTGVLSASAHLGSLEKGKEVHIYAIDNGLASSPHVTTALIDMYAKCGSIEQCLLAFYKSQVKDIYCWNALISGLALNGHGYAALKLFSEMRLHGVKPDDITFICLLSACCHSGLVEEGCQLFDCMKMEFGISPKLEHYGCMVDLLGRARRLDQAYQLVEAMPFELGASILGALLSACVNNQDLRVGARVIQLAFSRAPYLSDGELMMFANMYASCGQLDEAERWRHAMEDSGIVKTPGWSIIEVNGKFYKFLAGEPSKSTRLIINGTL
ncbi:hypothetical protein K2173_023157 [Erythroxylum novogranatense]|uniref:Pentatricopeptide repeat-containing protein n=1 Tax=Erythroxylum novogranatense TaxID=1862640 RepID=A0AAV8U7W4_9ROSI|nr:hypothetical protein K2173_023157 [Erythroxylum novogranatense]